MNRERRKRVAALADRLDEICASLNELQGECRAALEALPDNLQAAHEERVEDECGVLEEAADALATAAHDLQELSR